MNYLVTTRASGSARTQVWDALSPLALGHPFRWVLERTDDGVRIRKLGDALEPSSESSARATKRAVHELSERKIAAGAEVDLDDLKLEIRGVSEFAPVFEKSGEAAAGMPTVFACVGNWIMESKPVTESYVGSIHGVPIFNLTHKGSQYTVTAKSPELKVGKKTLDAGDKLPLSNEELSDTTISVGAYSWKFTLADAPALSSRRKSKVVFGEAEDRAFQRSLGYSALALFALTLIVLVWPKADPSKEELVPPQFAKIVMTRTSRPAAGSEAGGPAAVANTHVQNSAVVQAFRAKALQNAMSGLLKGGMTRLMTQSDFVTGEKAAGRKLFDTQSDALQSTAPLAGVGETNSKVASLGGAGVGGGKGYGKGEHAGVKGQGEAFVSMDMGGAAVEEGLTKDEVGEVIHKHMSEVRYCYESAMIRSPDIQGKLMVAFAIGGNGVVKTAEAKSSSLSDPSLDDCVIRRLLTWKFPEPRGHVTVAVSYPFIFKSLGR